MPLSAALLFQDETLLRLFPVLRRAWTRSGEQAMVGVTGHNARRVLLGAINVHTGHRVVLRSKGMSGDGFRDFLQLLRRRYPERSVWILLDGSSLHTSPKSQAMAKELDIELVWLPKQCPELNAMDHLFKEVKAHVSANHQHADIDEHAALAKDYILKLTNKEALKKAGILSKNFWLKNLL
jgi:transposase